MKTEEELLEMERKQLKMARKTSVVLGLAAVIAILFMIYGFTQRIEARRQRDIALEQERVAAQLKSELGIIREQLTACQAEKK